MSKLMSYRFLHFVLIMGLPIASMANPALDALSPALKNSCTSNASKLISRPEFASLLEAKPIDIKVVCECTDELLKKDSKLSTYLDTDVNTLKRRMQDDQVLVGYIVLRVLDSMLKCLQPGIAGVLESATLPE